MALSANTVWEVRTTGADTNGGGFVAGATGTDFSQQDAAQIAYTDMVIDGTTNTKFTSAANPVTSAHVGNVINIVSGTGFTVQRVYIVSQAAGVATCDKSLGTLSSTGGHGNLGGGVATIATALTAMVAQNIIFVKASATYVITAGLALANQFVPTNSAPPNQLIGYTTTRTDGGRATIQLSTNSNLTAIDASNGQGWYVSNFVIDGNSLTGSRGMNMNTYNVVRNCKVINCLGDGVQLNNGIARLIDSEVTACTSAAGHAAVNSNGQGCSIERCYIHDNTGIAIILGGGGSAVLFCVIASNSGTAQGIVVSGNGQDIIMNNSIYNNGQDGIQFTNNAGLGGNSTVRNNLLISNGRYGLNGYTGGNGWGKFPQWDGNAYFGNGTTNPVNAANPYSNSLDVTLSGQPFTNTSTHDFTLNSTAGAGAACKAAATPGAIPGLSVLGYLDMGALQSQCVAGATTTYVIAPNQTRFIGTEEN